MDAGGADENNPLTNLADTLGALIGQYEDVKHPPSQISAAQMLRFLMQQHQLSQTDLPEVGPQGVVSELLSGKRAPNVRQIKAIAARFSVPVSVFFS